MIDNLGVQEFVEEVKEEPKCMKDSPKPQIQELEKVDLAREGEDPNPIFISKDLEEAPREDRIKPLLEFKDLFVWNYTEIPGVDKEVSCHRLNVFPSAIPV